MSTLLVLTVGRTDVQLVVEGVRYEFHKDHCAALHDELERRRADWRFVETPIPKDRSSIKGLPDGELQLSTPKLDAMLRVITPTAALLLETRRTSEGSEPRIAGAVLEERLNKLGTPAVREAYLKDEERLEDPSKRRDKLIRRPVVDRLVKAVRQTLDSQKPSSIAIAATGGFPLVGHLVEEIVRLYASATVKTYEIADGSMSNPPTPDRAVERTSEPDPVVSFQARRRALELLEKGNLLGAWAVAEPLHEDEIEYPWTRVIDWVARFASSQPIPKDCNIDILTHHSMAVRAALRVEFALRAGDIPRAVHGTVAFFEAVLWDHLKDHIAERTRNGKGRTIVQLRKEPCELCKERDCSKAFTKADAPSGKSGKWYFVNDYGSGGKQLADCFLKHHAKFCQAIDAIRYLRNDVAHNEPTPDLMENARQQMIDAKLWSSESPSRFLTQEMIRDVVIELGEHEPEKLCENLIATVRSRLQDPTSSAGG